MKLSLIKSNKESAKSSACAPKNIILSASKSLTDKLLSSYNSSIDGISDDEADLRIEKYGSNQLLQNQKQDSIFTFLFKSINPLNILLITLAAISFFVGDFKAAIVISVMVSLSIILTTFQEYRSTKAIKKLRLMVNTTATVVRKNDIETLDEEQIFPLTKVEKREIEIAKLVPGDVIHLSAGDIIPADVRLISSKDLFINQSSLTGESMPVEKSSQQNINNNNQLELPNICYMGSNVVSGTAIAIVLLTGKNTFFARLAGKITVKKSKTNFDIGIKNFTWLMIRFMLVMVPVVFLINGFGKGDWFEAFLFAVAVAIGLTPEVLPMIVTINLARGAISMSRNKVIVRTLSSIQNFGAMDVLCCDKTGTLTQDKVVLEKYVNLQGDESNEVLGYAYLNSFYQTGLKNLLDRAILDHGDQKYDALLNKKYKKLDEIPFDFTRRRMSVVVEDEADRHTIICKGAVEEMIKISSKGVIDGKVVDLTAKQKIDLAAIANKFSQQGFRVIAVAHKELDNSKSEYAVSDESNLTLIGFMAFLDPPKETTAQAISLLKKRGVSVKILTGDAMEVSKKICLDVGIEIKNVLFGSDLEELSDKELEKIAKDITIFAKLSPLHKERIVKALQNTGYVVGFLGDGINDAAALKAADVGISVDSAVDVAKESADIVLLEKSLLVLEKGIIQGRTVFSNIIKYIKMGSSSNFGNMFSIVGASWLLPFLPMLPIQILTNNLLYDFSQASVATDNVDEEYLDKPRKWNMAEVKKSMLTLGPISSIFDYIIFAILIFVFGALSNPALFQTGWFVYSLTSQTMIIHIIRTNKIPFLQSRASKTMTIASLIIIAFGAWLPFSPLADSLGMVKLPLKYFIFLALVVPFYMLVVQLVKTRLVR